jgi:glycosyltransferase involved in cell wall biosynthesis
VVAPSVIGMIDVILPVLDEAAALPWILGRITPAYRAIVVDNGSSDGSAEVAAALGAHVVAEARRGFGAACHRGLLAAESDIVAFMDADASLDPRDLPGLVDRVQHGADLVLGARRAERGAWPLPARLANRALVGSLGRRTGLRVADVGPMRVAHRAALIDLGIEDRRFGWPLEMVVRAHAAGWRVDEVPVRYRPRVGRSKVTGTAAGFVRAVRDMSAVLP